MLKKIHVNQHIIKRKFSGTDNAGRFVVTFNDDVSKAPTLEPLTPSDMDKQFEILNKTVQQEIFISHRVVNPMLFGVKTEGQLGGRQEMVEVATNISDKWKALIGKDINDAIRFALLDPVDQLIEKSKTYASFP